MNILNYNEFTLALFICDDSYCGTVPEGLLDQVDKLGSQVKSLESRVESLVKLFNGNSTLSVDIEDGVDVAPVDGGVQLISKENGDVLCTIRPKQ